MVIRLGELIVQSRKVVAGVYLEEPPLDRGGGVANEQASYVIMSDSQRQLIIQGRGK